MNPTRPHPVGAGNVETSQRNADLLFRALTTSAPSIIPAAAGGSMNNVMMGGRTAQGQWAFYETLGVGLGGGPSWDGVDGIQSNMTNTMNTPVEEMERSFPVMVTEYGLRPDSSGAGKWRGGSGIVRSYKILQGPVVFTIVAERSKHRPWGLLGGLEGAHTEVVLVREGVRKPIPVKSTLRLQKGDELTVRTAGGGGYGSPSERPSDRTQRDIASGLLTRKSAKEYRRAG